MSAVDVNKVNAAVVKANQEFADEQASEADELRELVAPEPETREEYEARVQAASAIGVYGDIDTSGTSGDVDHLTTRNVEFAGVAVAQNELQAQQGDEEAQEASEADAARQVDVNADVVLSAEEADAGAEARDEKEGEGDVAPANTEEAQADSVTASALVDRIQSASTVEEVDEAEAQNQGWSTVERAADKRREELADNN